MAIRNRLNNVGQKIKQFTIKLAKNILYAIYDIILTCLWGMCYLIESAKPAIYKFWHVQSQTYKAAKPEQSAEKPSEENANNEAMQLKQSGTAKVVNANSQALVLKQKSNSKVKKEKSFVYNKFLNFSYINNILINTQLQFEKLVFGNLLQSVFFTSNQQRSINSMQQSSSSRLVARLDNKPANLSENDKLHEPNDLVAENDTKQPQKSSVKTRIKPKQNKYPPKTSQELFLSVWNNKKKKKAWLSQYHQSINNAQQNLETAKDILQQLIHNDNNLIHNPNFWLARNQVIRAASLLNNAEPETVIQALRLINGSPRNFHIANIRHCQQPLFDALQMRLRQATHFLKSIDTSDLNINQNHPAARASTI